MGKDRKIDQLMSVIVLLMYAAIIAIYWVMIYQDVPDGAIKAISIMKTVIQCLVFLVLLYNACGATDSIIAKIVFLAIALFLIASSIAMQVPEVSQFFYDNKIPLVI